LRLYIIFPTSYSSSPLVLLRSIFYACVYVKFNFVFISVRYGRIKRRQWTSYSRYTIHIIINYYIIIFVVVDHVIGMNMAVFKCTHRDGNAKKIDLGHNIDNDMIYSIWIYNCDIRLSRNYLLPMVCDINKEARWQNRVSIF